MITSTVVHPLTLQLLEWIANEPRCYADVLEAWRTSCPRLSVWEDACLEGLVECDAGMQGIVRPSARGLALLQARRGVGRLGAACVLSNK